MKKTITSFLFAVLLFTVPILAPTPTADAAVTNWQTGVTFDPRWTTDFASDSFRQSLRDYATTGGNYVTFSIPFYQSNIGSWDLNRGWNTPTDESLVSAIDYAHSLGLKVSLKPHSETYDGNWRAHINPSDRAAWFSAYGNWIKHWARLGQARGVESFVVGSELIDMATATSNPTNTQHWRNLIAEVRGIFSGKLTYSANWGGSDWANEKAHIEFWDALDYVGMSGYFVLNSDLNQDALKAQWDHWRRTDIEPLQQRWGKPVLFTEIGYRSMSGARFQPFNSWDHWGVSEQEQVELYTAFFDFWNRYDYIAGVHFWQWNTDPAFGGPSDDSYTPQHKRVKQVMTQWFTGSAVPTPTPTSTPGVTCPAAGSNVFTGCYFDNQDFTNLKMVRTDGTVNFDWGMGSPDPAIHAETFAVEWQGNFNFTAGQYDFTATTDDGMQVFVDGALVIDQNFAQPATTYTARVPLGGGTHLVRIRYFEQGGNAVAKVGWQLVTGGGPAPTSTPTSTAPTCPAPANGAFTGCYFDNQNFTDLKVSRTESAVNFDWGGGSPDPAVGHDTWSARWAGNFNFPAGDTTFTLRGDDGIRLTVDGAVLIDRMIDQPATTYTATRNLSAGSHLVQVDYYESGGNAVAQLSWNTASAPAPTSTSPSSGTVSVWWPTDGAAIQGTQPFKAVLDGWDISNYLMFWQVDGGNLNLMYNSTVDYPHKESMVDVSGWSWNGNGPYLLNFRAQNQSGTILGEKQLRINVAR